MAVYGVHVKSNGRKVAAGTNTGHEHAPVFAASPRNGQGNGYSLAYDGNGRGDSPMRPSGNGYGAGGGGNGNGYGNGYGNGNGYGGGDGSGGGGEILRSPSAKEQLYEILHVVFKRWRWIAALFLAVALPGVVMTASQGRRYAAKAKVMIVSERADVTIQPTEEDNLALVKLNEAIVNSEVHVMRSFDLMKRVATQLEVARAGGDIVGIANASTADIDINRRAQRIARRLKVTPIRNSNVIEVHFESGDENQATMIVDRVVDEYLAYTAEVSGNRGELAHFYTEQSRIAERKLRDAENDLSDFSYRQGIVAPAAELTATVTGFHKIKEQLRTSNASIVSTEARLQAIREQLAEQPSVIKRSQQLEVSPVIRQMRSHLVEREIDRLSLVRKYTDSHRHVRDNALEIAELQGQLDEASANGPTEVTMEMYTANPVYEARLTALLDLEAKLREDRAQKLLLEEELDLGQRHMVGLQQDGVEFDRRDREVARLRAAVDLYTRRAEEAHIQDAMDQARLVNVHVVERPGKPLNRIDSKGTPLLLALISALAVSLGGVFGLEYVNRTLRFEREVERYLGIPVIGTVKESH